jgi:multimeric flavodoxin WrbA
MQHARQSQGKWKAKYRTKPAPIHRGNAEHGTPKIILNIVFSKFEFQRSLFMIRPAMDKKTSGRHNPPLIGNIPPFAEIFYYLAEALNILASKSIAMQIIIVNGNPDGQNRTFEDYLTDYQKKLSSAGHSVSIITLSEMKLGFCRGCFNCWHTTPGICSIDDDIKHIHKAVINADLVIWSGPLIKGFFSSLLKSVQERMIPLLHPYVELVNGEIHHRRRYDSYPDFGVIVNEESDTSHAELLIMKKIQERYALNFRSQLNFFLSTETPVDEAIRETLKRVRADAPYTMETEHEADHALALYVSSLN